MTTDTRIATDTHQIHMLIRLKWDLVLAGVTYLLADTDMIFDMIERDTAYDLRIIDEHSLKTILSLMHQKTRTSQRVARLAKTTPALMVTPVASPLIVKQSIEHGVRGYLCLEDRLQGRFIQAIHDVLSGGRYLSPTAAEALDKAYLHNDIYDAITPYNLSVLKLMKQHYETHQIAKALGRSKSAIHKVQSHLRHLFRVNNNIALVATAQKYGVLSPIDTF
ncbi:response regulator transcription factor [Phototrophicus methaneseepsis]|uniref:Response regulator transcription factor n=1 Tax=Phototrophicus methaneseepsis TaxID=2710758 RepID=A0A7S8E5S8_9CHLR|nr:response regulator transcription factor [Phototrophicus methaneseepsis]QPC80912.1 response regulator transcription factor [Phototrophicus methaneseepsis]